MSTKAYIHAERSIQDWLQSHLEDVNLASVDQLTELLTRVELNNQTRLVFIQADIDSEALSTIASLRARHAELSIVAVALAADSATVLSAMRAGASEFFVRGQDDEKIPELVSNVLQRKVRAEHHDSHIISILSGHADTGLAFLGEHLSLAIAERQRQNEAVLLLDLAAPAGAAAVFMNVQHEYTALDGIADAYRCDTTLIDTAFPHHPLGPFVLSLPENLQGAPVIEPEQLGQFIDVLATIFATVIITADQGIGEGCIHRIAERSHHSLILSDQSILFSRHNQQLLHSLRAAGIATERAGLIVDRFQRRVGLDPNKLSELLQLPLYAVLAGDPSHRLKAMNAGDSLLETAPSDEYLRDVRHLAQQLLGRSKVVAAPKRGLLDRFLN